MRNPILPLAAVLLLLAGGSLPAAAHEAGAAHGPVPAPEPAPLAVEPPVAGAFEYAPPAPGSYRLPTIRPAADGWVLDEDGRQRRLHDLLGGRVTVLSFVYTRCGDVCPLASQVLQEVQAASAADAELRGRVRLLTLSFDPRRDTPEAMAEYAAIWRLPGEVPWHFLTTAGPRELDPILEAYDQPLGAPAGPEAAATIPHILRVLLIDPQRRVRNIYTLGFLDPRLVLGNIRTILMASEGPARSRVEEAARHGGSEHL